MMLSLGIETWLRLVVWTTHRRGDLRLLRLSSQPRQSPHERRRAEREPRDDSLAALVLVRLGTRIQHVGAAGC